MFQFYEFGELKILVPVVRLGQVFLTTLKLLLGRHFSFPALAFATPFAFQMPCHQAFMTASHADAGSNLLLI